MKKRVWMAIIAFVCPQAACTRFIKGKYETNWCGGYCRCAECDACKDVPFDLMPFLTDTYEVQVYVEEHEKGKTSKRIELFRMGKNKELLKDSWRYKDLPEDTEVWNKITDLSLFLTSRNDSTTLLTIKVPNAMTANVALKLHPLGKEKVYFYEARPYILRNNPNADSLNIPLILYGSGG